MKIRKGIRDLQKMNIVVKPADKNLGIVPIRGDIYAAMMRKWLKPPSFESVQYFPHADILRRLCNTIKFTRAISHREKENWIKHAEKQDKPNPFYAIPKIHKTQPLSSRPISAQHSYMLAPLSRGLAKVLLKVQKKYRGITEDTISFVQKMETFKTTKPFLFLTYDVEACYPNIDINDAINTLHKHIPEMRTENAFWTKILQLIMYNNYVTYNNQIYRQMIGTATGTQTAPPFANLYLYFKFKEVLQDPTVLFHERYIDDGFILVSTKEDAHRIIKTLNDQTNLNLTHDISETRAIFLDLVIYKGDRFQEQNILDLKTYFKPTNRLLYLPNITKHPRSMLSGIIIGEAIRTLRNSSSKLEWLKALRYIFKGLLARGYKPSFIQKAWKTVRWEERESYINNRSTKEKPTGALVFTSFHPKTKACWKLITTKYPIEDVFIKRRAQINKKQASILKNWPPTIVWSDFHKIGHRVISVKESWNYPRLGKRKAQQQSQSPNKRKRIV